MEDDYYYDVSDKSTVKFIYDTNFGIEFWDDLLIYNKTIENNSEILKSDIQIDLRMFKYLQKIRSDVATKFFINIIDKWAKQFSTVGVDDFKGQIDYYFPDSFQGFIDRTLDVFYLPFQRNVDFGKATIKRTVVFNMNNDDTECIFPESVEKIYCQFTNKYPKKKYTNQNFLLTLRKIVFPSNFTVEKINCNNKSYAIVPFRRGSFFKNIRKDENNSKTIGDDIYYYYFNSNYDDDDDDYALGYFTEKERELIDQRLKFTKPMEIKISKTFENNDEALKYVFGWELVDKEFELLKSWITYI
ncbi:MAG: hypothetical protein K2H56_04130 [Malacoplasma sp.]|nr:hypothetical protein [Malacoplasma sp.]